MRPVVPLKVAGQDSACRCGAGVFDGTPPENLTQVCRSWGPRNPSDGAASTGPRHATTSGKPGTFEDNDPRLENWGKLVLFRNRQTPYLSGDRAVPFRRQCSGWSISLRYVTLPARYVGAKGLRHPVCAPDPRRVWPMDHGTATGWQDDFPAPEPAGASTHDDGPESPRAAPALAATSGSGVIATRSLVGGAAKRASSARRVRVLESALTVGIPLSAVRAVHAVPSVRPAQADTAYEMRLLRGGRVIRTGHSGCTARSSSHCRMPFLGRRPTYMPLGPLANSISGLAMARILSWTFLPCALSRWLSGA